MRKRDDDQYDEPHNERSNECGIAIEFDRLCRDFDDHRRVINDWQKETKDIFDKVNDMNDLVKHMHDDTKHLNSLPQICKEMERVRWIVLILSCAMMTVFILREVGDRPFRLTPSGIEINQKANNASNN